MKNGHVFSFAGGELLAKMAAWWFVSYSYYLYVDRTHRKWETVTTEATRRSVYGRSKEYHTYWLGEIEFMERLDVHGNTAGLTSSEIKSMARKVLSVVSRDGGVGEMKAMLCRLEAEYERMKKARS